MNDLLSINVNGHTEKKNGLTYLSWAWAWAEVLKVDPLAEWEAIEYPQPDGTLAPCMYLGNGTAMVKTRVTIKGKTRVCMLPVMNHSNKAIANPDAFAVNTAIMRCMTKAISMHGLGLYIYAGEDLPEVAGEKQAAADYLSASRKDDLVQDAQFISKEYEVGTKMEAFARYAEITDTEERLFLWELFADNSKLRTFLNAAGDITPQRRDELRAIAHKIDVAARGLLTDEALRLSEPIKDVVERAFLGNFLTEETKKFVLDSAKSKKPVPA